MKQSTIIFSKAINSVKDHKRHKNSQTIFFNEFIYQFLKQFQNYNTFTYNFNEILKKWCLKLDLFLKKR